jgi:hypothetical protein
MLVEFLYWWNLVKFSGFLRHTAYINRNLKLINLSTFLRIRFKVKVIYFKAFLFIIKGGK